MLRTGFHSENIMENIALIGIDLGKNSFHIHCQDHRGKAVYRKKFTRPKLIEFLATCPATTIAMEACGGSHFMAQAGRVRAFSKADITAICPPIR
jgi:transposase